MKPSCVSLMMTRVEAAGEAQASLTACRHMRVFVALPASDATTGDRYDMKPVILSRTGQQEYRNHMIMLIFI